MTKYSEKAQALLTPMFVAMIHFGMQQKLFIYGDADTVGNACARLANDHGESLSEEATAAIHDTFGAPVLKALPLNDEVQESDITTFSLQNGYRGGTVKGQLVCMGRDSTGGRQIIMNMLEMIPMYMVNAECTFEQAEYVEERIAEDPLAIINSLLGNLART